MVKGVNKQIIEVNNPDSIYFEKAVFYLKPGVRMLPVELSSREINHILTSNGFAQRERRSMKFGKTVIFTLTAAVTVGIILIFLK